MSEHDQGKGLGSIGGLGGLFGMGQAGLGTSSGGLGAALRGVGPREIGIASNIRSIAGRMMHHEDPDVRSMAAELLRHVERLETGK